jgi:hypothetical protein
LIKVWTASNDDHQLRQYLSNKHPKWLALVPNVSLTVCDILGCNLKKAAETLPAL